ncbi:MAG TPA: SRPBCC domain-containing protein [Terriglobia bacterium]|nr:SRPBCC domain-containing protein [Terriglobia bacterium]
MATATFTPDNDAVLVEILVAAPPARVFQAITDPRQTAQWWGQKGTYRVTDAHADVRPGGKWWSAGVAADGTSFRVEGEYLEVEPPRLLVHTWNPSYSNLRGTVVRWELVPHDLHGLHSGGPHRMGTGTLVKLRHSGFAGNIEQCQGHGEGWKRVLGWMQAFVEKGETIESRG